MSIPERINPSFAWGSFPTCSVSRDLSSVMIWETLATDSFDSPVNRGASARFRGRPPISSCWSAAHIRPWQFGCGSKHRPARPRPVAESRGRSRLARGDRPTKHPPGDHHWLHSRIRRAAAAANSSLSPPTSATDAIHGFGHALRGVTRDILGQGKAIHFAPRLVQMPGQTLGFRVHFVGN